MEPSAGLFENRREATLTSTIAMVEDVLIELGHFVNDCRVEVDGTVHAWLVKKGSATVRITVEEADGFPLLRVIAPVMSTDARVDTHRLYRHLLRLNCEEIVGAAFAVRLNEVLLVTERSILDLDRSEVFDLIRRVQTYADSYDDKLVKEFGGRLGGLD